MHVKRSAKVAIAATAAVLLTGGVAFAYWTSTGTATGSALTGDVKALVVTQVPITQHLTPGHSVGVQGSVENTDPTAVHLTGVTGAIGNVVAASGKTCDASNYTITSDPNVKYPAQLGGAGNLGNDGKFLASKVGWFQILTMKDLDTNQDGCKGATVNLVFTAN